MKSIFFSRVNHASFTGHILFKILMTDAMKMERFNHQPDHCNLLE